MSEVINKPEILGRRRNNGISPMTTKLAVFNEHMLRVEKGIELSGACSQSEFYATATTNANKATRKDYVMRASFEAIKQYAPLAGKTGTEVLEWASHLRGIMAELDIEKLSVGEEIYAKPAALGENQFYRTQWCQVIQNPTNAIYVDPRRLWIDVNSIVEI